MDDKWRKEIHERREIVVRASLGADPRLSRMAMAAVHALAP